MSQFAPNPVGSNIFELVEFTVTSTGVEDIIYGVNVAKVREVIRLPKISPCITPKPEILGFINLRGAPIPIIHLERSLGYPPSPIPASAQVIVTEITGRLTGFLVWNTRRIRRVNWEEVIPPPSETFTSMTGMISIEDEKFLFIIDFERILMGIENTGEQRALVTSVKIPSEHNGSEEKKSVAMIIDDSGVARRALAELLHRFNLETIEFPNAEAAWKSLTETDQGSKTSQNLKIIISDVEMPRMDGYSFIKKLKSHQTLKSIPAILHTSLTGNANREKGTACGADAYVSKLNAEEIAAALKKFIPINEKIKAS